MPPARRSLDLVWRAAGLTGSSLVTVQQGPVRCSNSQAKTASIRPEPERHAHPPACFSCTLALAAATPAASCTAKRQDKMHCTAASRPPRARASLAPAHDRPSPWLCSPASPLLPDPLAPCDAVSAPAPAGMRAAGGGTRTSRFCGRAERGRDEEGSEQRRQPVGSTRSA